MTKHFVAAITTLTIIVLSLVLWVGLAEASPDSGYERRVHTMLIQVLDDLKLDFVNTEEQRDQIMNYHDTHLNRIHEQANGIRELLCLTGASMYCPTDLFYPDEAMTPWELEFGEKVEASLIDGTKLRLPPNAVHSDNLEDRFEVITLTYYNPLFAQTDGAPCIAFNMDDICKLARGGMKIMALSRDLVNKVGTVWFDPGDFAYLSHSNPACSGVFRVLDTMNAEFNRYGDIFSLHGDPGFHKCKGVTLRKLK